MPGLEFVAEELAARERDGLRRRLRTVDGPPGREITLDGRRVLNFCSNNYLGLADSAVLRKQSAGAIAEAGTGAGASRLIGGTQRVHVRLESALAELVGKPAALTFNSGYHANVGVIPALVGRGDVVYSDELNHASLIDGCRLSRADVIVFRHGDVADLDARLAEGAGHYRRRLIASDAVFSMDGDIAPVAALADIAARHGAMLMLDEAHAVGVLGPGGAGVAAAAGVDVDVHVGTLGKAFGSFGAYVAGSAALVQYLVNTARSFVFTTALPPAVTAASLAAVTLVRGDLGAARRAALSARVEQFRVGLAALGLLAPGAGSTPIFPIVTGDNGRTMACCEQLLAAGIYAQGIRPPTVPVGTSRLRFALMATHTTDDVDRALAELAALQSLGLFGC